jgi:hypothetical protein
LTYFIRIGKSTAIDECKCLFKHDAGSDEYDLALQSKSVLDTMMYID